MTRHSLHLRTPDADPLAPARLGPVELRNRVIKSATFEGMSPGGLVSDRLIDFHRSVAAGGVGMTTVAYCATSPEGRSAPNQIMWTDESLPGLRRLTDVVHDEGAAASAQIGHAGAVGNIKFNGLPAIAPSRGFRVTTLGWSAEAKRTDIERVIGDHARAAERAVETGFDAVEIHIGHNYLLSSFLSPKLNRRDDEYGGSLENRARFARATMRAVRDAVGDKIAITAKLNMDDGVQGGFWLLEAIQVAQWLEQDGSVDALEMTAGSSLLNPMYLFRGTPPMEEFSQVLPQPQRFGLKFVGDRFLRNYPYQDLYLLEDAKQIRAAVSLPLILLGGVTSLDTMRRAMAEGFEFVAMGRALLREPDLVNTMMKQERTTSLCNHCNKCMVTIYRGTRCVFRQDND